MNFGTALIQFLTIISAVTTIGLLLSLAFLLPEEDGKITIESQNIKKWLTATTLTWSVMSALLIIFTLANFLAQPLSEVVDFTIVRSFLTQTSLGKVQLIQLLVGLLLLLLSRKLQTIRGSLWLLLVALAGISAPFFQSHTSTAGHHGLAIGSILLHITAISLWFGGVIALVLMNAAQRTFVMPRFSVLALWAALTVVVSGFVNAWTRLNTFASLSSGYGLIVLGKVILMASLIFVGYRHRQYIIRKLLGTRAVMQLLFGEILLMLLASSFGVLLTYITPPSQELSQEPGRGFDRSLALIGISMPDKPTISRILFGFEPDGLIIGLLIIAVALYLKGVLILTRRGDRWPVGRTISFALGVSAINFATSGGLGLYAHFAFSFHMIAHMILGMIAPIGIILGAPITLALRTLPASRGSDERGLRGLLVAILASRPVVLLTHPIIALTIFDGSLFALYFTSLFGNLMGGYSGHLFMNIHFILAGLLFFYVIIGIDPNPRKVPHLFRMVILFAAMSIHAFFSVALMSSTTLLDGGYFAPLQRPWLIDLLADQKTGGAIGWAMGEIPILLALIATFIQWIRDDERDAKRGERNSQRLLAAGKADDLAEYNAYLSRLSKGDTKE